jgi:cytochrome b subunit of formate dehydrogenase
LLPSVDTTAAQRIAEFKGHWFVHVSRILAVLSGVFMLYGFDWARWLLVVWLVFHVILSVLHSPFQLLVHSLLFAVVLYFLFRPPASAYFRGARTNSPQIPKGG